MAHTRMYGNLAIEDLESGVWYTVIEDEHFSKPVPRPAWTYNEQTDGVFPQSDEQEINQCAGEKLKWIQLDPADLVVPVAVPERRESYTRQLAFGNWEQGIDRKRGFCWGRLVLLAVVFSLIAAVYFVYLGQIENGKLIRQNTSIENEIGVTTVNASLISR